MVFPERFDASNVGALLGEGNDHEVYAYDSGLVAKLPKSSGFHPLLHLPSSLENIRRDLRFVEQYLGPAAVAASRVLPHPELRYVLLQERLPDTHASLRPRDVERSMQVREQLQKIFLQIQRLLTDQALYLELVGWEGYKNRKKDPRLSNVKIVAKDTEERLLVTDFTLRPIGPISEAICDGDPSQSTIGTFILQQTRCIIGQHFGFQLQHPFLDQRPNFSLKRV